LTVVDGNELLARQGALSFEIWFDRPAPLRAMREALAE
jgi:shikimate 5-dehydrogenase